MNNKELIEQLKNEITIQIDSLIKELSEILLIAKTQKRIHETVNVYISKKEQHEIIRGFDQYIRTISIQIRQMKINREKIKDISDLNKSSLSLSKKIKTNIKKVISDSLKREEEFKKHYNYISLIMSKSLYRKAKNEESNNSNNHLFDYLKEDNTFLSDEDEDFFNDMNN